MRDISTKVNGVSTLPDGAFNSTQSELENIVTDTGISLDPDGGADTDLYMMSKAAAIYSSDAGFYTDSGAADAYVLAKVGSLQHPVAYFDGMMVEFKAANSNTGASNVNVAGLGSKNIYSDGNIVLARGEITAGKYIKLRYRFSTGRFELVRRTYRNIVTYTSGVTNYSKPDGLAFVKVICQAGGGGGGGVQGIGAGGFGGGGGGGGGSTSIKIIPASSLGSTEVATVGAGGNGGAAGNNNGLNGVSSTFGAHLTTQGGFGGSGDIANNIQRVAGVVLGGSAVSGDMYMFGGDAIRAVFLTASALGSCSGGGGTSLFASGGVSLTTNANGFNGFSGSGGGGGFSIGVATDYAGGDGGGGLIKIEEYF